MQHAACNAARGRAHLVVVVARVAGALLERLAVAAADEADAEPAACGARGLWQHELRPHVDGAATVEAAIAAHGGRGGAGVRGAVRGCRLSMLGSQCPKLEAIQT